MPCHGKTIAIHFTLLTVFEKCASHNENVRRVKYPSQGNTVQEVVCGLQLITTYLYSSLSVPLCRTNSRTKFSPSEGLRSLMMVQRHCHMYFEANELTGNRRFICKDLAIIKNVLINLYSIS